MLPLTPFGGQRPPSISVQTSIRLNRRTRHRRIRAEHAAIPRLRPEAFPATFAVINDLAGVPRHSLDRLMPALRAGDGGLRIHVGLAMVFFAAQVRQLRTTQNRSNSTTPSDWTR